MTTIQRLCAPTLLALTALAGGCDSFSGEDGTASGTTSSGSGETSETTEPSPITISDTAPPPTTEPVDTDGGEDSGSTTAASDTDGSDTDAPTSAADTGDTTGGATETDGETDDTTGSVRTDDTIYEVQDGTIAEGSAVVLEGVVITGLRENIGVFVQEPAGGEYSGVYVDTGTIDLTVFAVGDIVDVTGVTSEDIPNPNPASLVGLTGILTDEGAGDVVAAGGTMELTPASVTAADLANDVAEPWESVLVTLEGPLTVQSEDFDSFGEFRVSDGDSDVLIDNFLYGIFEDANAGDFPGFSPGATFSSITGPLDFSFGNFKVAPRSADELAGYVAN